MLSAEATAEIAEKLGCEIYQFPGYKHAVYDEYPDIKKIYANFL